MSYPLFKFLLLAGLVTYFVVGVSARVLTEGDEDTYPFFSWFLFSKVPPRIQDDYLIKILEYRGQTQTPPLLVEKTPGIFNSARSLAEYFQMTRNLGVAVKRGDTKEISRYRTHIENNLFSSQKLKYQVLEVRYNLIDRYRNGSLLSSQEIAVFESGVY